MDSAIHRAGERRWSREREAEVDYKSEAASHSEGSNLPSAGKLWIERMPGGKRQEVKVMRLAGLVIVAVEGVGCTDGCMVGECAIEHLNVWSNPSYHFVQGLRNGK